MTTSKPTNPTDIAVAAMLFAFCNSCRRSETRGRWTANDQRSHDKLRAALILFMGEEKLDQSVMQILSVTNIEQGGR
jgi:hypothetical protein